MHNRSEGTVPSVSAAIFGTISESFINYEWQAEKIAEAFSQHGVNSIIELGCGTGTLLVYLAKRGFQCLGVDLSQEFLLEAEKKAQTNGVSLEFLQADITKLHPGKTFDAAICLRVPLTPSELRDTLAAAYRYLAPHGLIVIEFMTFNDSAPRYWTREFPNPITTLNVINHDGKPAVKMTSFYLEREHISVTAVYLGDDRGFLQMWAFNYSLWPMQRDQISTIIREGGFTIKDTLFIEFETVPGADGHVVLAQKSSQR
jgi:ubiquinone/menaquinone biosynthesis C-methylase UbiE